MDDDEPGFAETVIKLEDEVDRACNRAESNGLSREEIAKELERIAQAWRKD